MSHHKRGFGQIAMLGLALALPLSAVAAQGAGAATGGRHVQATSTKVIAKLEKGKTMDFAGTINGFPVTVTCTTFSAYGYVSKTPINISLPKPPVISGCTDSLGGTDTVTTNQTNGKWRLVETVSGTSKYLTLWTPKAGATFSSSILSSCTITAAPTKAAGIKGTFKITKAPYNGTDVTKNAKIPVSGSGCAATSSSVTATVVTVAV